MMNDATKTTQHTDSSFWLGLFLGGLTAAVVVQLMHTRTGKQLIKDLHERGDEWLDAFEEKLRHLDDIGEDAVQLSSVLKKQIATGKPHPSAHSSALKRVDDTLSHIEKLQSRGRTTTSRIRRRLFKNTPRKSAP